MRDESRNDAFLAGAQARGLLQLKGHKSVGGMRASLYNAVSEAASKLDLREPAFWKILPHSLGGSLAFAAVRVR